MVNPADIAEAVRLADGSLILERSGSDEERQADELELGMAGWQVIARCERPGEPTLITWAKTP